MSLYNLPRLAHSLAGFCVVAGMSFFTGLQAAVAQMPVGVAKVDITPDEPIRLSGYGSRETPSEEIAQRLWAKALAFGSDEEGPGVLITADLIGFPGTLTEEVARRLADAVDLDRAQVAFMATHTHTGPVVLGTIPNLFGERIPADELLVIDRYTANLREKLVEVALEALAAREPARVGWAEGTATFATNRRIVEEGKWTGFGADPKGPTDHDLPVLRVTGSNGELKAVLLSYACHCTTLTGSFNAVHGDWAATAAEMIEAAHPGAVALIAIGTGADQNPQPRGGMDDVVRHGEEIAREVGRLLSGPMQPVEAPPRGRFSTIELSFEHVPSTAELVERSKSDGAVAFHARMMLDRLARGERISEVLPYPLQVWAFGADLAMVFLAGEVVVDYGLRLKRELERVWVNAYANDLVCYVPSRRIIPEGGYEVDGSMDYYDRPSRFSLDVEDAIIDAVHELTPESFAKEAR